MSRRVSFAPLMLGIVLALAVAALAFSAWKPDRSPAGGPQLELTSQHLRLTQSRPNQALITLPNAKPGQVGSGATRLSVSGASANLSVSPNNLHDVTGRNGGALIASKQLWIEVRCAVRPCGSPPLVYRGPLMDMGTRSMGTWPAGATRAYRVRVWLRHGRSPTNTTGNNAFQGSRAKFGLVWTATAA